MAAPKRRKSKPPLCPARPANSDHSESSAGSLANTNQKGVTKSTAHTGSVQSCSRLIRVTPKKVMGMITSEHST